MTKLTQQEIEKEREMFEAYMSNRYQTFSWFEINNITEMYQSITIQTSFEIWFARAELAKGGE